MDDLKSIIWSISNSEYLSEWIQKLKDNDVLFCPQKNIKPCIHVSENSVRSSIWEGLTIIKSYCDKGVENDDINMFIINLINSSIDIYLSDEEADKYKRLNSSDLIVLDLLEIVVSKPLFINSTDVVSLIEVFFDSALAWPYSLLNELYKHQSTLLASRKNKSFEIYKTIIEKSNKSFDYEDFLEIPALIENNPIDYYNYAKKYVVSLNKVYFDMGSFFDYNSSYTKRKDVIIFKWLKASSKLVEIELLEKDITAFISSENRLLKKIGLCLININYDKAEKLFLNNIHTFFNDKDFYADLCMLLINNANSIFVDSNKEILLKELGNAQFGGENDWQINTLKKHLSGIFIKNGYIVSYSGENDDEKEFAVNFNKAFYISSSKVVDKFDEVFNLIKKMNIHEAVEKYASFAEGSKFYLSVVNKAYTKYLIEKYSAEFYDYLDLFNPEFCQSIIFYLSNDNTKNADLFYKASKAILLICEKNPEYKKCLSSILFELRSLFDSVGKDRCRELLMLINYQWLSISEFSDLKEIINSVINEDLYSYLMLLCNLSNDCVTIKERLFEVLNYFVSNYDCHKLKSVIASMFHYLMFIDLDYSISNIDYVFSNAVDGLHLSYPLLALSNGHNEKLLKEISVRSDLYEYLSHHYERGDNLMAQTMLFNWFYIFYLKGNNSFSKIINIVFETNNYQCILELIRNTNHWLNNNKLKQNEIDKYLSFLKQFMNIIQNHIINFDEIDQLIREISKTIILLENKNGFLWNLLIALFKHFKHYFSEETINLINIYQNEEVRNISKILDLFFSSYSKHFISESALLSVYKIVSNNNNYRRKCEEWRVCILSVNPDLLAKL